MSSPKPTIVLVPGACTLPVFYDAVSDHITSSGYEFHVPQLRTVEVKSPAATMQDDVDYFHAILKKLADEGRDIVLVMHSYGGLPGTESANGLIKSDRAKQGKKGGIIRLVYLTSLAAAVGESMASTNEKDKLTFDFTVPDGDYFGQEYEGSAKINFSDLPLEKGVELVKQMPPHSLKAFIAPLTYPAYNYVPVSYIKTTRDLCLPPWWQDNRIKTIEEASGNKVDLHVFDADHCCNTSQPIETADIILKIAGASQ